MTTDDATGDELERIRRACVELGADEEMTELVLASHRHDRTLLDVMLANGDDLRDYVRYKLAIWEAIFNEPEECTLLSLNVADGAILGASWSSSRIPGVQRLDRPVQEGTAISKTNELTQN